MKILIFLAAFIAAIDDSTSKTLDVERDSSHAHRMAAPPKAPTKPPTLRMVTWNVNDNADPKMGGTDDKENKIGYDEKDIEEVLGITKGGLFVDIYAIGLQENCWRCDPKQREQIAKKFMNVLNKAFLRYAKASNSYDLFKIEDTKNDAKCLTDPTKDHGTTALVFISKTSVVEDPKAADKTNLPKRFISGRITDTDAMRPKDPKANCDKCKCSVRGNQEKGFAYMKFTLKTGKKVCLATSHLESRDPEWRSKCFKYFLEEAESEGKKDGLKWTECDFHFISGDFNTRTDEALEESDEGKKAAAAVKAAKDKSPDEKKKADVLMESAKNNWAKRPRENPPYNNEPFSDHNTVWKTNKRLTELDELTGSKAFGYKPGQNLLKFINGLKETPKDYKESLVNFAPSYKLDQKDEKKKCKGKKPCYKSETHPDSWCDRIIHTGNDAYEYGSVQLDTSDHDPVFGEFTLA